MKILSIVKTFSSGFDDDDSYSYTPKAGLFNSARMVVDQLNKLSGIDAKLEYAIDGNSIDRLLHQNRPDICILEAIWATPDKVREVSRLHPRVIFIVRIHSRIPFLAMEGVAINWIKEFTKIPRVIVSFNNEETSRDMKDIGIRNVYLPNIYSDIREKCYVPYLISLLFPEKICKKEYHIGCFGAIRPMKNQLEQAVAAIKFAEKHNVRISFYVNAGRVEQGGNNQLKNLRSLFKDTRHKLVEVGWLDRKDFLKLVAKMDVSLQVSYTESFNIVAADSIKKDVPLVTSKDISWISVNKADPNSADTIVKGIENCIRYREIIVSKNRKSLINYNKNAIQVWRNFLRSFARILT